MRAFRWRVFTGVVPSVLLVVVPHGLRADVVEFEPNNTCETAQYVGWLSDATTVRGELHVDYGVEPPARDVDFYAFEAEPGSVLRASLLGASSGAGSLVDPVLGLYDSSCRLIDWNDDGSTGLDSAITFEVPEDGAFVLAASGFPDFGFSGDHMEEGGYALVIAEPPPAIGSISGRIVDGVTGVGLPGNEPPFAFVNLNRCYGEDCWYPIASASPDHEGRFEVTADNFGNPIEIGSFRLDAWAGEYEPSAVGPFTVGAGEHRNLGNLGLNPPPIVFGAVNPCAEVPERGGTCRYSVDVVNNTPEMVRGLAWSNVQAWGTGSVLGYSHFTAAHQQVVNLRRYSGNTLRFSFEVPAGVADYAVMCADAWFSNRENAFLGSVRSEQLFCVQKRGGIFVAMDAGAARVFLESHRQGPRGKRPVRQPE
jgi:hypothetical protein